MFLLSQSEKFSSDRLPDIKGDINISVPEQLVANEMLLEVSVCGDLNNLVTLYLFVTALHMISYATWNA